MFVIYSTTNHANTRVPHTSSILQWLKKKKKEKVMGQK